MNLKPLYDKLTPSQRQAVDSCMSGDDFAISLEVSRLNTSIQKIFAMAHIADTKWLSGQCQHFLMILNFLTWVKKNHTILTTKDIQNAVEPKSVSRERFTRFRSLSLSESEENGNVNHSSSEKDRQISKNKDKHDRGRDSLPTPAKDKSKTSKCSAKRLRHKSSQYTLKVKDSGRVASNG